MTAEQIEISEALGIVRYLPGSWSKRFGNSLALQAEKEPEKELTEAQNEWMYRLLYKYRKQLARTYEKHKGNPLCAKKQQADDKRSVATRTPKEPNDSKQTSLYEK